MTHSWIAISAPLLLALLLAGCQYSPPGYRRLGQSHLTPHAASRLTLPGQVGDFHRGLAFQGRDDPGHVRVMYGHRRSSAAYRAIQVENSSLSLQAALQEKSRLFIAAHSGAVLSESAARAAQPHFPGWRILVFDYHGFVADFPPILRSQPQRVLLAARTIHGQTVFLETKPLYEKELADFLPATSQFARDLFPPR